MSNQSNAARGVAGRNRRQGSQDPDGTTKGQLVAVSPAPLDGDRPSEVMERWRNRVGDRESETVIVAGSDSVIVTSDRGADICAILERAGDRAHVRDLGSHVRISVPRSLVGNVSAFIKSSARSESGQRQAAARGGVG
jgi:hypothetical protein